jgi:hypothetical protein
MAFASVFYMIFGVVIELYSVLFLNSFPKLVTRRLWLQSTWIAPVHTPFGILISVEIFMNLNFIRDIHDWEIESLDSFLTFLYSMNPLPGAMDNMVRTPSSRHGFAVKSYYTMLTSPNSEEPSSSPGKAFGR